MDPNLKILEEIENEANDNYAKKLIIHNDNITASG